MNLRIASLGATIVLLALGAVAAACGGDNGGSALTLDQYFERLEQHAVDFEERGLAAEDEFDFFAADSEEEAVELAGEFFREASTLYDEFVDELDNLNPPNEIASIHDEAVGLGRTAAERLSELVTLVEDAQNQSDLDAALSAISPDDPEFERFSEACFELQDIADENDISVDLLCG